MNRIFGYQIFPEDACSNKIVFDGTKPVEVLIHSDGEVPQLRLFASYHCNLKSCYSWEHGSYSYVWGIPAHPEIETSDLPAWCASVVASKRYASFRELLGPFVVIVDEPRRNRLTFVTDVLGVRPIFYAKKNGRVLFGSEVWPIYDAGLISGVINYDAVSAWIAYGFNCTGGSLFADLRRFPPGSAIVFEDGKCTEIQYAKFEPRSQPVSAEQVINDFHDIVSTNIKSLLSNHPRVTMACSGGYDSRYLLALSLLFLPKTSIECATVCITEEEGWIANKVAETFGVPLKSYPVKGSVWDLYDDVYHFSADGLPISKFVTHCIAQEYPGIPMMNGFMGDSLMPAPDDRFLGSFGTEEGGGLADVLQRKHLLIGFDIFRPDIAKRIQMRSRLPMEKAALKTGDTRKSFFWADLYYRQRHYISNNFLQHIGLTEALLPFYSWELISYKMEHEDSAFNRNVYYRILHRHFPEVAKLPHASDLSHKRSQPSKTARCTRRWARRLLTKIRDRKWLSLLEKNRSTLLTLAGITGFRRVEDTILTLQRLYLLEKKAMEASLYFDWECI